MNDMKDNKCNRVRELLSEALDQEDTSSAGLQIDGEPVGVHIDSCAECRAWRNQTRDFVALARSLPQFDVPEHLTQSILSKIASEDKARQQQLSWVVYAVALVSFPYVILFVDACESVWGIGSWLAGFATMLALRALVCEPSQERQVA